MLGAELLMFVGIQCGTCVIPLIWHTILMWLLDFLKTYELQI